MKKLLLTGGLGYIGSHTCVELLEKGYEVVIIDNLCNSDAKVKNVIEKITGKSVEFFKGDILNSKFVDKVFAENKFDAVIHLAGLKAVGESVQKPLMYYENNVCGSVILLKAMQKHGVKKIVFSSSACVYGNPASLPIFEDFPLAPTNPYGQTKVAIEKMLEDLCTADKDFTAVSLRYFNPIGAHQSGLIGENPKDIPNNLAPYIAQTAAGIRPYLSIFGNDWKTADGTGVRDYIHVVDLAVGHMAALERIKNSGYHVFNLGTGNGVSVLELLHAYEKACGKEIPYKFVPRRDGDIAICYADCGKAKQQLKWTAKLNVDQMCQSMVTYTKAPRQ